jgi:hypothetical protein
VIDKIEESWTDDTLKCDQAISFSSEPASMTTNNKLTQYRQQRIQKKARGCHSHDFFSVLTSDELLGVVGDLLPEHRERRYPPTETLSMFLSQALHEDDSWQKVANEAAMSRVPIGLSPGSVLTRLL